MTTRGVNQPSAAFERFMEAIDFIISRIWRLQDFFAGLDEKFIAFAGVGFCLGFLVRRLLNRRLANDLRDEIEDLSSRLKGAERLLFGERRWNPYMSKGSKKGHEVLGDHATKRKDSNSRALNEALLNQSNEKVENEQEPRKVQNPRPNLSSTR